MKTTLSSYLKLFVIGLILNLKTKTPKAMVDEIHNMTGKTIIGKLPAGILQYLKKIDG